MSSRNPYNSQWYSGINPYALGFAMFQDIRRICEQPTEEDKRWFPDIAGKDWLETLHFAMREFKDESFISQFLSPKLMRDFRLFAVADDDRKIIWKFPLSTTTKGIGQSASNCRHNII